MTAAWVTVGVSMTALITILSGLWVAPRAERCDAKWCLRFVVTRWDGWPSGEEFPASGQRCRKHKPSELTRRCTA